MKIYYVDGAFVPSDKAVIPVDDLSVLRGYGVCDIMRTYHGRPYFIDEHIRRLRDSAAKINLELPWTEDGIKRIVLETLGKNRVTAEANIRIVVTGGSSPDFMTPRGRPRLIVLVTPIKGLPDHWYTDGVKVITHFQERALAGAKVTSYIPAALALEKARTRDAVEAIYVDQHRHALEGTTSNLFAFFGDTLTTPDHGILHGITRKLILSLARELFRVEERPIPLEELLTADEVFITGTNKGVVPVVRIDDTPIGDESPGTSTRKLIQALESHAQAFMAEEAPD